MIIEHFFLAQDSSVDIHTNMISIFGLIEDLQFENTGSHPINFPCQVILFVKREQEAGAISKSYTLQIFGPDGNIIGAPQAIPTTLQPQHKRTRVRVNTSLPVTRGGDYRFTLSEGANVLASSTIGIIYRPTAV